jgi:riboflavin synthase
MFTGIIETIGTVIDLSPKGKYSTIAIAPRKMFGDLSLGDSIAIDGCCLTVVAINKRDFVVEASPESINLTIIKEYRTSAKVNLERALLPSSRMGGHFVTGHIDTVGRVSGIEKNDNILEMQFAYPDQYKQYIVSKGSVAINGVSLTVNGVVDDRFSVNLIPHTRKSTNFDLLIIGDNVNLEFDIIGKYIINLYSKDKKEKLTLGKLIESGW